MHTSWYDALQKSNASQYDVDRAVLALSPQVAATDDASANAESNIRAAKLAI